MAPSMPDCQAQACHLPRCTAWSDLIRTGPCRSGTTPCLARSRPATRCPATPRPTSPSSGPASPACGRPTTWPSATLACGSSCASGRSPGSAPRAATAAGARRCSRPRWRKLARMARPRRRHRHAAGDARDRRRGRPGRRRRGHRLPLGQGRHGDAGPVAGAARTGEGGGRRGARVRLRRGGPAAAGRGAEARAMASGHRGAGRHVYAALRRDPPGPAGARAGRRGPAGRGVGSSSARPCARSRRAGSSRRTARCGPQYVVRATEGYTPELPGSRRAVAPVYSLMIATEPLPAAVWDQIGLAGRPTFGDLRHLIIYGQRTADGRFAFGGRGAPYHLGSSVRPSYDQVPSRVRGAAADAGRAVPGARRRAGDAITGAGRWASPGTGAHRSGWIPPPASAGPAVTWVTGSRRPTWPGERWPT